MMVKIGVIFMSFSNPTCHFRDTADFTVCTVCTLCTSTYNLTLLSNDKEKSVRWAKFLWPSQNS